MVLCLYFGLAITFACLGLALFYEKKQVTTKSDRKMDIYKYAIGCLWTLSHLTFNAKLSYVLYSVISDISTACYVIAAVVHIPGTIEALLRYKKKHNHPSFGNLLSSQFDCFCCVH
jgi:hypothetical protein